LNRLTQKSYNDNPQTPTAYFYYDETTYTLNNTQYTLNNTRGRLSRTSAASGTAITLHSYDAAGRTKDYWQCVPSNCSSATIWHFSYSYNLAGDVTSWTHPASYTVTNSITRAERISQITSTLSDSTHPGTLATLTYAPQGAIATVVNGCVGQGCVQVQQSYDYNNRLQPVRIRLGTSGTPDADYCLVYNYYGGTNPSSCAVPSQSSSGDNGNAQGYYYLDLITTSHSHTASYTYDNLNRLTSSIATGNSTHNLDFSYDRYGNMTCVTDGQTEGYCPNLTFGATTNRLTTSGYTYDAAGNLTADGSHSYQWDGEGRMKSVDSGSTMTVTYNAFGQQVKELSGWENAFDAFGQWIGRYNSGATNWDVKGVFKLGGRMVAMQGSTWTRFIHPNALGSTTVNTDHSGAAGGTVFFYPWGQVWSSVNPAEWHFAAFDYRDAADLDPTLFRMYNSGYGRWLSPDPVAGNVGDPQSLNRYAYVLNNPTTLTDSLGLDPGDPFAPTGNGGSTSPQHPFLGPWFDVGGFYCDWMGAQNWFFYRYIRPLMPKRAMRLPVDLGLGNAWAGDDQPPLYPFDPLSLWDWLGPLPRSCDPFGACGGPGPQGFTSALAIPIAGALGIELGPADLFVIGLATTYWLYTNKDAIKNIVSLMNHAVKEMVDLMNSPDQDPDRRGKHREIRAAIDKARVWIDRMSPGKAKDIYTRLINAAERAVPEH
jgi:RHS repeat-associated protein